MKREMKRVLYLLLSMILLIGLAACSKKDSQVNTKEEEPKSVVNQEQSDQKQEESNGAYKAGTYKATTKGHNGDLSLEVEFSNEAILSVNVLEHAESAGISDPAFERIPKEIVEGQTLAVDTIAGATVTSNAILTAIEDCVVQAGGNTELLKEKKSEQEQSNKETEMTTDVVVVGAGGAGLVAAASAKQNGAEVIVLEKLAMVGGSTALSGGGVSATGTKFQEAEGIEDSKESWMELWKERQSTSNPNGKYPDYNVVDKFMDEAVITTEWLVDEIGHEYGSIMGFGLDPVRRLHFAKSETGTKGGTTLVKNVEKYILGKDVKILTETPATELITDDDGNVIGVIAQGKEGTIKIYARKVILAAGGYAKSEELLERFIPEVAGSAALSAAAAGSTGDGITMAEKVGAALYEEPWVIGLGVVSKIPGTGSLGMDWTKVYVNEKGERFTNEQIHYSIATNKITEQEVAWLILDSTESNTNVISAFEEAMPTEEVVKADTLDALGEAMGVPVDTFVKNMNEYNDGAKTGNDAMGKEKDYLVSVEKAPYYAVRIYPYTMGTFAGVKTNENYLVIREDGSVINNLYAVGENANKVLYNQVYMSGSAVQFAMTSGRLAGEHAAKNLK